MGPETEEGDGHLKVISAGTAGLMPEYQCGMSADSKYASCSILGNVACAQTGNGTSHGVKIAFYRCWRCQPVIAAMGLYAQDRLHDHQVNDVAGYLQIDFNKIINPASASVEPSHWCANDTY